LSVLLVVVVGVRRRTRRTISRPLMWRLAAGRCTRRTAHRRSRRRWLSARSAPSTCPGTAEIVADRPDELSPRHLGVSYGSWKLDSV